MTTRESLTAFIDAHEPHGAVAGGAGPVGSDGYEGWARCPCGAEWRRFITDRQAAEDFLRSPLLAEPN